MKKVLIALDYNPSAQKIAETGYSLAKSMQAEVVLLHVMADPTYYAAYEYSPIMGFNSNFISPETLPIDTMEELKKGAIEFLASSKEHLGDASIQTLVLEGETAATINKAAVEMHADIIVLGSHSRRGLEKILMGSVAEKVLHHSNVPLFLIPTKE
ncbi:MAG: universal stress protein [Chitinophagaceae bacterium]